MECPHQNQSLTRSSLTSVLDLDPSWSIPWSWELEPRLSGSTRLGFEAKPGLHEKNFIALVTVSVTKRRASMGVHLLGGIVVGYALQAKGKKAKRSYCVPKPHPPPSEKTHLMDRVHLGDTLQFEA